MRFEIGSDRNVSVEKLGSVLDHIKKLIFDYYGPDTSIFVDNSIDANGKEIKKVGVKLGYCVFIENFAEFMYNNGYRRINSPYFQGYSVFESD